MAGVRSRLAGPLLLSDQSTEIYRVPSGKRANVRRITAFNGADHSTTLTISIGADSASTRTLDEVHIPARRTYESKRYILSEGETIEASAAYANEVTIMLNGYLETVGELENPLPVWLGQTAGYDGRGLAPGFGNKLYAVRDWLETRYGRCRLTHLSIYCGSVIDGMVRLGFFDDSGDEPETLLATTAEFTPVLGWNTHPVLATVEFDPATYWVSFVCSSDLLEVGVMPSDGIAFSNGAREVDPFPYASMPSTFPSSTQYDSLHFSVYATLEAKTISRPAPDAQQITPAAIIGQGMSLAFQDEMSFYDRLKWNNMIWYDSPPWEQDSIYVEDGVMHIVSKRPPGWQEGDPYNYCTVSTLGRYHFTRGYFECRLRFPSEDGDWPAFWMISSDWAKYSNCAINQASEIDVMEGVGDEPGSYYGTLHSDSSFQCETNVQNANNWQPITPIVLTDQWHVYGAWWTETFVKWYLDGAFMHEVAIGPGTDWDEMEQEMQVLLYMWTMSNFGGWTTHVNSGSADHLHTEVDWVRIWQVPTVPPVPTQTSVARISLEGGDTPPTDDNHSIRVRARIQIGNGTIRAALYQGGVNISGDLESPYLSTDLSEHYLDISPADAANITDYSNLEIRFWGYDSLGGSTIFEIDQIWLHIPAQEGE